MKERLESSTWCEKSVEDRGIALGAILGRLRRSESNRVILGFGSAGCGVFIGSARGSGDPTRVAGRPGDLQRHPG
jgi:hypothetical protein